MIIVDGVLKVFVMIGWCIGFICVFWVLVEVMGMLQGQLIMNVVVVCQVVVMVVIEGFIDEFEVMCFEFDWWCKVMIKVLCEIVGVKVVDLQGVFYVFFDLLVFVGKKIFEGKIIVNDVQLCEYFIEVVWVVVVLGFVFGVLGYVWLFYVILMKNVEEGVVCIVVVLLCLI